MSPDEGLRIQVWRVFKAELSRALHTAPISLVVATLVFPFLTILALYVLPGLDIAGKVHFQRGAYSGLTVTAQANQALLTQIKHQPYYRLEALPDAAGAFARGEVDLALTFSPSPDSQALKVEVLRRNDFFSSLFLTHLRKVTGRFGLGSQAALEDRIIPEQARKVRAQKVALSSVAQTAPFLLVGFAWFFLTVGVVEAFVVERERRTLELLHTLPISREALVLGRLSFIFVQALGPQLAGSLAWILLGFSPWVLTLTLLTSVGMIPVLVAAFRYYRELDSAKAAGWRNGLIFMLLFPLFILGEDVLGTLSPLYHLARALEGQPPLPLLGGAFLILSLLAAASLAYLPRAVRGWVP